MAGLLSVAALWLLPQVIQGSPRGFHRMLAPVRRQTPEGDCKLWVSTDIWTTCQSLIDKYNITLPDFVKMNPSVQFDCYSFEPGQNYCLRMPTNYPISTDGSCGAQAPTRVTCIGSTFGDCCGKTGQCGSTDEFCAIGNCQAGICPGLGYSTDGNCGPEHGNLMCGGPYGNCCSNAGVCGSTSAECGLGNCQYGDCVQDPASSTTAVPTSTTSSTPLPSPYSPSPDGTCGYRKKYICTGTSLYFGYCCSAAGYCGTTQYHCSTLHGCMSEFGLCDEAVKVTVTSDIPDPTPAP